MVRVPRRVGVVRAFRELKVWSKAHALTIAVFLATRNVRRGEFPGLVSQLRRAAASIPTNIAEGCGHAAEREFARFLQMALASASELEYHLLLAFDLGMLPRRTYVELDSAVTEVKRMLTSLIQQVRARDTASRTEPRLLIPDA